jgi:hypothetical protein
MVGKEPAQDASLADSMRDFNATPLMREQKTPLAAPKFSDGGSPRCGTKTEGAKSQEMLYESLHLRVPRSRLIGVGVK